MGMDSVLNGDVKPAADFRWDVREAPPIIRGRNHSSRSTAAPSPPQGQLTYIFTLVLILTDLSVFSLQDQHLVAAFNFTRSKPRMRSPLYKATAPWTIETI